MNRDVIAIVIEEEKLEREFQEMIKTEPDYSVEDCEVEF